MKRPTISSLTTPRRLSSSSSPFSSPSAFSSSTRPAVSEGGGLTRHSHYARVRLGGLTIWRIQCTTCKAVFTVLPHFVLRYRTMRPEVARDALLATHGGLSLEWCATICHISPMALYRLICALGQQSLVTVLTRCGLPLPVYILADEKHSRCLTDGSTCPPSSAAVCSGIWATARPKAPRPSPSPTACFNARPLSMSRRTRCRAPSPMALTVPSAVCGPCFRGHVWASACATRSTNSRQADRRLGLGAPGAALEVPRPAAPVSTAQKPAGGGIGPAPAPLCRSHHHDGGTKRTASAFATGSRTRRRAGMRCSQTHRCRR